MSHIWENMRSLTQKTFSSHSNIEHLNALSPYYFAMTSPSLNILNSFTLYKFFLSFPCFENLFVYGTLLWGTPFLSFGTDLDRCFDDSSTKNRRQQTTPPACPVIIGLLLVINATENNNMKQYQVDVINRIRFIYGTANNQDQSVSVSVVTEPRG